MNVTKEKAVNVRKVVSVKCTVCSKRAFDINKVPNEPVEIQLKCPNCHKIVNIPIRNVK